MSWRRTRLKHLCTDAGQYGLNISAESYATSGVRLIRTSDITESGELKPPGEAVYVDATLDDKYMLRLGDILLSRSGTLGRSLLVQHSLQLATYAGYLVRFRPRPDVDPRFLSYSTIASPFQDAIRVDAVSSTIQNFNAERYANIALTVPGTDEQRRIANFLDVETASIERTDQLLARLASSLEERVRSALDHLFGSDPETGPTRLKYLLATRPRYGVLVPEFVDDGVLFIRVNDLLDLGARKSTLAKIPAHLSNQYKRTIVRYGDVLVSVVGTLGRAAVATADLEGANIARAVASLRPAPGINPHLLLAWTRTSEFERQALLATGSDTAQPTLGMEDLASFRLRWPLTRAAQGRLLRNVLEVQESWSQLAYLVSQQRHLLAERRRALVTAAVTGEIDVTTARGVDVS